MIWYKNDPRTRVFWDNSSLLRDQSAESLGCVKIYLCIYKMRNESALKTIQFRCNLSL